jgi:hypothetical protein
MDTILSAVLGGGTGLLGSIFGKLAGGIADYFATKQKIELAGIQNGHELELLDRQIAGKKAETEAEVAIVASKAAGAARMASYEHDASYGRPYRWVVSALRMVRPSLTVALIGGAIYVYAGLSGDGRADIGNQIVYMAGMAVAWWFGDRGPSKK